MENNGTRDESIIKKSWKMKRFCILQILEIGDLRPFPPNFHKDCEVCRKALDHTLNDILGITNTSLHTLDK